MRLTGSRPGAGRRRGRSAPAALLAAGALAALLLPACTAAPLPGGVPTSAPGPGTSSTPAPSPSSTGGRSDAAAPSEPSEASEPSAPSEAPVAASSEVGVDGLTLTLPLGLEEHDRARDEVEEVVLYDNLDVPVSAGGSGAFVEVSSFRGAYTPFDVHVRLLVDSTGAQIGHGPDRPPRPVDVPGATRTETVRWDWTATREEPDVPYRSTYVLVEAGPVRHWFVKLGGTRETWTDERVEDVLASMSVDVDAA